MLEMKLKNVERDTLSGFYTIKTTDGILYITPEEKDNIEGMVNLEIAVGNPSPVIPVDGLLVFNTTEDFKKYKDLVRSFLETKLEYEDNKEYVIEMLMNKIVDDMERKIKATFFVLYDIANGEWEILDFLV
jgi:hypothetical protein